MSNVRHYLRSYTARDLPDTIEVDRTWISRSPADQQLRLMFFSQTLQFVVIDVLRFAIYAVVSNLVIDAQKIKRVSMGQMSAVREIHSQYLVPVIKSGHEHRHIRLSTGMRLDVRVMGIKD